MFPLVPVLLLVAAVVSFKAWRRRVHGVHGCHRGPGRHGRFHARFLTRRLKARLGLDDAQEATVAGAVDSAKDALGTLRETFRGTRTDLVEALGGPVVDDAALAAAFARHDGALAAARAAVVAALKDVHATLTPEQRVRATALLTSRWG